MTTTLFVCVHNAGRSQMAASIFNSLAERLGLPVSASSAGTQPADRVHPNVVHVMEEWGIDLTQSRPQMLTDDMGEAARRVITMGCEIDAEACPALFIRGIEDWGLPDPAGQGLDETREIRDTIARKVCGLIQEILVEGQSISQ